MLEINNAGIRYNGTTILSNFSLSLKSGEMACITGPSGRGKSSLLNAVLGLVPLYEGTITINGTLLKPSTIDMIRRQIAWIPQEVALPLEWVYEMIKLPFTLKANRDTKLTEEDIFGCFDKLNLEHSLYRKRVREISGGQKQRIMLATAAMLDKRLFVIDEPTSALDSESMECVFRFLREQADKGCAILAVSHDMNFANRCDKIIRL